MWRGETVWNAGRSSESSASNYLMTQKVHSPVWTQQKLNPVSAQKLVHKCLRQIH